LLARYSTQSHMFLQQTHNMTRQQQGIRNQHAKQGVLLLINLQVPWYTSRCPGTRARSSPHSKPACSLSAKLLLTNSYAVCAFKHSAKQTWRCCMPHGRQHFKSHMTAQDAVGTLTQLPVAGSHSAGAMPCGACCHAQPPWCASRAGSGVLTVRALWQAGKGALAGQVCRLGLDVRHQVVVEAAARPVRAPAQCKVGAQVALALLLPLLWATGCTCGC
jgi:hypothetical protein